MGAYFMREREKLFIFVLGLSAVLNGDEIILPVANNTLVTTDVCSTELITSFFPDIFVGKTLEKFNIPKDQWESIMDELDKRNKSIRPTLAERGYKINPNLFTDPQQQDAARKLLKDIVVNSFTDVMKIHGINDPKQVKQMLDDIQMQKAEKWAQCMRQDKPTTVVLPTVQKEVVTPVVTGITGATGVRVVNRESSNTEVNGQTGTSVQINVNVPKE